MNRAQWLLAAAFSVGIGGACGGAKQRDARDAPGLSDSTRYSRIPKDLGGPPSPAAPAPPPPAEVQDDPMSPVPGGPKLKANEILANSDRVAAMGAVRLKERTLVVWTTYADSVRGKPAARNSGKPKTPPVRARARVLARLLDSNLTPISKPIELSSSAESVGGVAVAPGRPKWDEACVAWIEADATSSQLGFALVASDGRIHAHRVNTGGKPNASDVALARNPEGWVAAWIDQRDGAPQVYAGRVNAELKLYGAERRLSRSGGEPSEVQLISEGDKALVAWNSIERDRADVNIAALHDADLQASDTVPIATSRGSVHGVRLGSIDDRIAVAWIHVPAEPEGKTAAAHATAAGAVSPLGTAAAPSAATPSAPSTDSMTANAPVARIALLDWNGRMLGDTHTLKRSQGARSIALGCAKGACRVAIARATPANAALNLGALVWQTTAAPGPLAPLLSIDEVAPEDASPVVVENSVLLAEDTLRGQGRLRKLAVEWP